MDQEPGPDTPLLTARTAMQWRLGGRALPRLPDAAVLTHQAQLLPRRRPWQRDPRARAFSFDLRELADGAALLAGVRGVGAPATAVAVEELAVAGVVRLVVVDIAGSLVEAVPSGSAVLVSDALACDGTSPHYAPERRIQPDASLTDALRTRLQTAALPFTEGAVWSTDAVYRETVAQVHSAREQGAVLADMETACAFAVARALGIRAAALLVAADELHAGWRPPAGMRLVHERLQLALDVALAALAP